MLPARELVRCASRMEVELDETLCHTKRPAMNYLATTYTESSPAANTLTYLMTIQHFPNIKSAFGSLLAAVLASRVTARPGMARDQTPIAHFFDDPRTNAVPGNNNATYGPVPKAEQIFTIEFLEIAPLPMPVDRYTFFWLRGLIAPQHVPALNKDALSHTTITLDQRPSNEEPDPTRASTLPLKTIARPELAGHFAIRGPEGKYLDYLSAEGKNDLLAEMLFLAMFMEEGEYTFDVVARLADGT
ncbi:hypothetical protein CLAFUW4_07235 [Fulvia fulva]|uniref:Uncharacterized protein n=1 Tax=Passalora fulva TaxID=5499 RepID=A0A9Q8UQA1_PASFU|nr:uncharacterized protein CLAFUR5_07367 [Fulvia fulva]KAK4621520.1 hypothetical protein CLAFUR4_07243 [Fulvia fulva]KAK4623043.1 hypothetical protein CLAFUR0_07240 [Fulvia fulva]UJO18699.1 hypothetical protein CLAFUR5_07367 [Fulvia fulva]WPV16722.1 hypothetical protein CLAFUW4_07235 [Fulvia fulva]WPV31401.1 hypothetical protein CLAFUW7_07236 [Fulvia fulva]